MNDTYQPDICARCGELPIQDGDNLCPACRAEISPAATTSQMQTTQQKTL